MFNDIQSGFAKFASPQRMFVLILFLVLAWFLTSYSDSKGFSMDGMGTGDVSGPPAPAPTVGGGGGAMPPNPPAPSNPIVDPNGSMAGANYTQRATVAPSELLPSDANSQWAALNPVNMNQGNILQGDLLQPGYHIGIDTIGNTMKIPILDIRSPPIIPKIDVGPWNQGTNEPDYARVPLEIGAGYR